MDRVLEKRKPSVAAGARGNRCAIPVPITVSGIDKDGQAFREDSRTLVITRNGLMIETSHPLSLGSEITAENPALGQKSTGRVVWCGGERSAGQVSEVGLYVSNAEILCGIELAPEETREFAATPKPPLGPAKHPSRPWTGREGPDAPGSEYADGVRPLPTGIPGPEPAATRPRNPDTALAQEFDLTSELGHLESIPPGSELLTSQPLRERISTSNNFAESGPANFSPLPDTSVGTEVETGLSVERLGPELQAALSLLEQRVGEVISAQAKLFEHKLRGLVQQSLSEAQLSLQVCVAGLEQRAATLTEQQAASSGDRWRRAHDEVEELLARLEALRDEGKARLEQSLARQERSEGGC